MNKTQVTPALIKELRDRTGVGMGKCKEALEEAKGDLEEAISILRKAGMATAVKKEGRETNQGVIAYSETPNHIAVVEVNAETDFVVQNARFQEFVATVAEEAAKTNPANLEAFLAQQSSKDSLTIDQYRATIVQSIGENIQIRRIATFEKSPNKTIGVYSHLGGKILTLVEIEGAGDEEAAAKEVAMHVAAAAPEYLDPSQIPESILEKEREIARELMKGKPAAMMDKIVEGKLNAYFDAVTLLRQKFIKDDSVTIGQLVEKRSKETGKPLKITNFIRWSVGQ